MLPGKDKCGSMSPRLLSLRRDPLRRALAKQVRARGSAATPTGWKAGRWASKLADDAKQPCVEAIDPRRGPELEWVPVGALTAGHLQREQMFGGE
jgi:hypothetical protein